MVFATSNSGHKLENVTSSNTEIKIETLPPSAKLVFKILENRGLLTQKEIARESYLPARTVRYALNRLKKTDFLEERFYFKDARQSLYGLKEGKSEVLF
ncbi:MAG: MarR family transcriptional regulator [Candidatus Methanoperedens sp.]|nr:MarR family transcriptional regulator [Candidatus Methanoperedens sp.]MCE8424284.1 MarR family transcriptional regulator [Candidatus Methanoperedens sp.]MCE8426846.1 MarR family transcriptional regulator [Candidatus Methanoperedens sp.]